MDIGQQLRKLDSFATAICKTMNDEIKKAGFFEFVLPNEGIHAATFDAKYDSYAKHFTLEGVWRDERGNRCGCILFHGDGSFYAEYDIVRPHPSKKRWFVESVTAWGREPIIKAELKLLPTIC